MDGNLLEIDQSEIINTNESVGGINIYEVKNGKDFADEIVNSLYRRADQEMSKK